MPRRLAAIELAKFFGVLAHPLRVEIVEELGNRELTVNDLQACLQVAHASVSQHLAILRSNRVVVERREGRHVYYHVRHPELAIAVRSFLPFVSPDTSESDRIISAIESAKNVWTHESSSTEAPQVDNES